MIRRLPTLTIAVLAGVLLFAFGVGCPAEVSNEGQSAGDCSDGADNDGDGDFDCNDSGCAGSPDCGGGDDESKFKSS